MLLYSGYQHQPESSSSTTMPTDTDDRKKMSGGILNSLHSDCAVHEHPMLIWMWIRLPSEMEAGHTNDRKKTSGGILNGLCSDCATHKHPALIWMWVRLPSEIEAGHTNDRKKMSTPCCSSCHCHAMCHVMVVYHSHPAGAGTRHWQCRPAYRIENQKCEKRKVKSDLPFVAVPL